MDRAMHRPKEQSRPAIIFSSSAVKAQAEFEGGEDVAIFFCLAGRAGKKRFLEHLI